MLMNNNEYIEIIETIKGEIRGAQYKAALSVNRELIIARMVVYLDSPECQPFIYRRLGCPQVPL